MEIIKSEKGSLTGNSETMDIVCEKYMDEIFQSSNSQNIIIKEEIDMKPDYGDNRSELNNTLERKTDETKELSGIEKISPINTKTEEIFIKSEPADLNEYEDELDSTDNPATGTSSNTNNISKENVKNLIKEIKTESGKKIYKCEICNKILSKSYCVQHVRIHTGERPFKCDWCSKAFPQSSDLIKHKRIHTGEKKYKCEYCGKTFAQNCYLSAHRRFHTGEKPYRCEICGKKFPKNSYLSSHKRTHSGLKPYKCHICNKSYTKKANLVQHKKKHTDHSSITTQEDGDSIQSAFVDETDSIKREKQMKNEKSEKEANPPLRHIETVYIPASEIKEELDTGEPNESPKRHISENNVAKCKTEDKSVDLAAGDTKQYSQSGLTSNDISSQINIESIGIIIKVDKNLKTETENHTSPEETNEQTLKNEQTLSQNSELEQISVPGGVKFYKCNQCGKTYSDNASFIKHKRKHDEKLFKCKDCGKIFSLNSNLNKHKHVHSRNRIFKCLKCGKTFISAVSLSTHERRHSSVNQFKCEQCGKVFAQSSHLTVHKRGHTGDKPYKCEICGRGFAQNGHMIAHKRVHSGEKPFPCEFCGRGFAQNSNLVSHKRTHIPKIKN